MWARLGAPFYGLLACTVNLDTWVLVDRGCMCFGAFAFEGAALIGKGNLAEAGGWKWLAVRCS